MVNSVQPPKDARSAMAPETRADRDDREAGLEGDEGQRRDRARHRVGAHEALQARRTGADCRAGRKSVTNPPSDVAPTSKPERVAERHAVAEQDPEHTDGAHADETHHDHVQDALGPDHAAVEERETGGHQQHQCGSREDPGGVACADFQDHGQKSGGGLLRVDSVQVTKQLARVTDWLRGRGPPAVLDPANRPTPNLASRPRRARRRAPRTGRGSPARAAGTRR